MRVVLGFPHEARHRELLAQILPDAEFVDSPQEDLPHELLQADIFCGHVKVPVDWERIVKGGRLRWIQSSAAGMDHCLTPPVIASDIVVTSASGLLADQVAEHTTALVTGWCRSLPVFFRAQQKKEFIRRPTRDLTGATVAIVGFGGVGRRIAQIWRTFKTRLLAVDKFPVDKPDYVETLVPPEQMLDVIPQAEVVVLCLPLNRSTRKSVGAAFFSAMKSDALFANVARGAIVVHEDLIEALRIGHLAGAVMDVTDPEPLPPESPLWDMQNVIITPHVGGQVKTRADDVVRLFAENLRRWKDGRPLINRITNKEEGYPFRDGSCPLWIDVESEVPRL
ncbi:D-2-hydroxyacid dehydrogenase [Thermostilla marina]